MHSGIHVCESVPNRCVCDWSTPAASGAYNFWIGVEYTRVVPDRKNHRVVIDLIETIVSCTFQKHSSAALNSCTKLHVAFGAERVVEHLPLPWHPDPPEHACCAGH